MPALYHAYTTVEREVAEGLEAELLTPRSQRGEEPRSSEAEGVFL